MTHHPGVLLVVIFILICIIAFLAYVLFSRKTVTIDGHIIVSDKDDGGTLYSLELNIDPDEISNKELLTFQVRK